MVNFHTELRLHWISQWFSTKISLCSFSFSANMDVPVMTFNFKNQYSFHYTWFLSNKIHSEIIHCEFQSSNVISATIFVRANTCRRVRRFWRLSASSLLPSTTMYIAGKREKRLTGRNAMSHATRSPLHARSANALLPLRYNWHKVKSPIGSSGIGAPRLYVHRSSLTCDDIRTKKNISPAPNFSAIRYRCDCDFSLSLSSLGKTHTLAEVSRRKKSLQLLPNRLGLHSAETREAQSPDKRDLWRLIGAFRSRWWSFGAKPKTRKYKLLWAGGGVSSLFVYSTPSGFLPRMSESGKTSWASGGARRGINQLAVGPKEVLIQ